MTAIVGSEIAMTAIVGSEIAINAIYKNSDTYATLLESELAMTAIAGDQTAILALIGDSTRCQKLSASTVAMAAVSASTVAMAAVSASTVARNAIQTNSASWKVVTDSNEFIAKFAIGCLDSSTYKPENFANVAAIIANTGALTVLAASSTAMTVLAASSTARSILWNNQSVAMVAINKVDMAIAKYAIGCLNNSSYNPVNFATMSSVIANQGALGALAGSSVAMNALAGSSVAMNALAGSSVARNALKSSPLATEKTNIVTSSGQYWSGDGTISIKGLILYTTSGNTDNAFGIKTIDGKTVSNAGERNASTSGSSAYMDWYEAHPNESLVKSSITIRAYYTTTKIKYIPIN